MKSLRALVVDDSLITINKITAMLTEMGHRVVGRASSGAEALEVYRECMPDFVTMDITMPDMDGIQATQLILKEYPNAFIIVVTSHGEERRVLDALNAGAKGYILKPVKLEKFRAMVAQVPSRGF